MGFDLIISLLRLFIVVTYGVICLINIIFSFFLDKYQRLNDLLEIEIFSSQTLTVLESNLNNIDEWFFAHHRVAGLILFFLSLFDAYMLNNLFLRL